MAQRPSTLRPRTAISTDAHDVAAIPRTWIEIGAAPTRGTGATDAARGARSWLNASSDAAEGLGERNGNLHLETCNPRRLPMLIPRMESPRWRCARTRVGCFA